jgi:AcrR family transcriptional regulator
MSSPGPRKYVSKKRDRAAEATRTRVLRAARALFAREGIDRVTIVRIAERARVSEPTVYALFQSKVGILRALVQGTLFGPTYRKALRRLEPEKDAVRMIALTAGVARSIYESESAELGLLRGAAALSPALREMERELEAMRFALQEHRVRLLFAQSRAKRGLTVETARRLLWMYTSRDVYRMLVQEGGWTPDQYERWLSETLLATLVEPAPTTRIEESEP